MNFRFNGYARAIVHMAITLGLAVSLWFFHSQATFWVLISFAGLLFFLDLSRLRSCSLNDSMFNFLGPVLRPEERWHLTGASFVLWGVTATALCFPTNVAVSALIFLAVGDAVSGMVGNYFSSQRHKSARIYRSTGCLIACLIAGVAIWYSGLDLKPGILVAGAITATVVESIPSYLNDNISIPLTSALAMFMTTL